MKISTKSRYGIIALIDLVINSEYGSVTLKAISERQNISERYLEQIFSLLRKSGLIIGKKGAQGGYTLTKHPNEITIGEILKVLEGDLLLIDVKEYEANEMEGFVNREIWSEINKKINDYFESITLEEIVNKYKNFSVNLSPLKYPFIIEIINAGINVTICTLSYPSTQLFLYLSVAYKPFGYFSIEIKLIVINSINTISNMPNILLGFRVNSYSSIMHIPIILIASKIAKFKFPDVLIQVEKITINSYNKIPIIYFEIFIFFI